MCQERVVRAQCHESAKVGNSWSIFLPSPVSVPLGPVTLCLGQPCLLLAPPKAPGHAHSVPIMVGTVGGTAPAHISHLAGSLPSLEAQGMVGDMGRGPPLSAPQQVSASDWVLLPGTGQGLAVGGLKPSITSQLSNSTTKRAANGVVDSMWHCLASHQLSLPLVCPGRGAGAQTQARQGSCYTGISEGMFKSLTPWHTASTSRTQLDSEITKSLNRPSLQLASGCLWAGSGGKQEQLDALRPVGVAGSGGRKRATLERAAEALVHQLDVQLHADRTDGSPQKKARTSLLGLESSLSRPSCLKEAAKLLLEELDKAQEETGADPGLPHTMVTGLDNHESVGALLHIRRDLKTSVDKFAGEKLRKKVCRGLVNDEERKVDAGKGLPLRSTAKKSVLPRTAVVELSRLKRVQQSKNPWAEETVLTRKASKLETELEDVEDDALVIDEEQKTVLRTDVVNEIMRRGLTKTTLTQCRTSSSAPSASGVLSSVSSRSTSQEQDKNTRTDQRSWPVLFGCPLIPATAGVLE